MYDNNTLLIVGQAKPSREDAIYTLHGEFYISPVSYTHLTLPTTERV